MIDSELSWKHHIDFICHKISRSVGIIAKTRHYIPRHLLLNLYHALIAPYLNYGICAWGDCPQTYLNKILVLQKRALRLIYFSKPRDHAIPFFIESNCLPLQSLFFQQLSYLMYDVHAKTQLLKIFSTSLRKSIQNIIIIRDYLQKNVSLLNSLEQKK